MSLVAYGSSGEESDSSDSEEVQSSCVSKELIITNNDGHEDGEKLSSTREGREVVNKTGLVLPSPKQSNAISNSDMGKASLSLSSFLPKPKNMNNLEKESTDHEGVSSNGNPSVSLVTMMDDEEEILEIEEEYEPITKRTKKVPSSEVEDKPKSVGSLFSLLPSPWQAENTWLKGANLTAKAKSKQTASEERASKQPIKIAIPTAPKTDSDDEDDIPAAKKIPPSKEVSSLKSLLPKPKHSITMKADNPNKPSMKLASRPLIPHTLTKKATPAEKKPRKTTKMSNQAEGAISDDEDEPVSFFTFSDKSESLTDKNLKTFQTQSDENSFGLKVNEPVQEISNPSVSSFLQGEMPLTSATSQSSKERLAESMSQQQVMEERSAQVASGESFSSGELETKTYYYEQQPEQNQQYQGYSANDYQNYSYDTGYYGQESEAYTYIYPTGTPTQKQIQPQETNIDLEKLHKLKGKRNRHEEINIVDVNADDQIANSAEMVAKYGTEEVVHRPSRKKKDMPTAQQRRKHQITYLAFQAKEREFELRQQWSANRQTRRQTQSKYGF